MDKTRPFWARKYGTDPEYSGYHRLTSQGYVGIGWPEVGDITGLATAEEIRDMLNIAYPRDAKSRISWGTGILHAFINTAQVDDLVAVHSQENDRIYIGRIISPCEFNINLHNHFHLLRQVEWCEPLHPGLVANSQKDLTGRNVFWKVGDPTELLKAYKVYEKFKLRLLVNAD